MAKSESIAIPLTDDIGVYARCVQSYLSLRSVTNLALVVLSQRVIVERVRAQRSPKRRADVLAQISRINKDPEYRARMAADPGTLLGRHYVTYRDAALIVE